MAELTEEETAELRANLGLLREKSDMWNDFDRKPDEAGEAALEGLDENTRARLRTRALISSPSFWKWDRAEQEEAFAIADPNWARLERPEREAQYLSMKTKYAGGKNIGEHLSDLLGDFGGEMEQLGTDLVNMPSFLNARAGQSFASEAAGLIGVVGGFPDAVAYGQVGFTPESSAAATYRSDPSYVPDPQIAEAASRESVASGQSFANVLDAMSSLSLGDTQGALYGLSEGYAEEAAGLAPKTLTGKLIGGAGELGILSAQIMAGNLAKMPAAFQTTVALMAFGERDATPADAAIAWGKAHAITPLFRWIQGATAIQRMSSGAVVGGVVTSTENVLAYGEDWFKGQAGNAPDPNASESKRLFHHATPEETFVQSMVWGAGAGTPQHMRDAVFPKQKQMRVELQKRFLDIEQGHADLTAAEASGRKGAVKRLRNRLAGDYGSVVEFVNQPELPFPKQTREFINNKYQNASRVMKRSADENISWREANKRNAIDSSPESLTPEFIEITYKGVLDPLARMWARRNPDMPEDYMYLLFDYKPSAETHEFVDLQSKTGASAEIISTTLAQKHGFQLQPSKHDFRHKFYVPPLGGEVTDSVANARKYMRRAPTEGGPGAADVIVKPSDAVESRQMEASLGGKPVASQGQTTQRALTGKPYLTDARDGAMRPLSVAEADAMFKPLKPAQAKALGIKRPKGWMIVEGPGHLVTPDGRIHLNIKGKDGKHRTITLGKKTFEDWKREVMQYMSPADIDAARRWYPDARAAFHELLGPDLGEIGLNMWLVAQSNTGPTAAMSQVMRIMRYAVANEGGRFSGGLAGKAMWEIFETGYFPAGMPGAGPKIWNFFDSASGKTRSSYYGNDVRIGSPAAIDLWQWRNLGGTDPTMLRGTGKKTLRSLFADDPITLRLFDAIPADISASKDGRVKSGGVSAEQYDFGHRTVNAWTNRLKKENWMGLGSDLTSFEMQAIGWVATRRAHGWPDESPRQIIMRDTEAWVEQAKALRNQFEAEGKNPAERLRDTWGLIEIVTPNIREDISFEKAVGQLANPARELEIFAYTDTHDLVHNKGKKPHMIMSEKVLGKWRQNGEASVLKSFSPDMTWENLVLEASVDGYAGRQLAVAIFKRNEGKNADRAYEISLPTGVPIERARSMVDQMQFDGASIETSGKHATRIWMLDKGKQDTSRIEELGRLLDARVNYQDGRVEFLGDKQTRDESAAVFRATIEKAGRTDILEAMAPVEAKRASRKHALSQLAKRTRAEEAAYRAEVNARGKKLKLKQSVSDPSAWPKLVPGKDVSAIDGAISEAIARMRARGVQPAPDLSSRPKFRAVEEMRSPEYKVARDLSAEAASYARSLGYELQSPEKIPVVPALAAGKAPNYKVEIQADNEFATHTTLAKLGGYQSLSKSGLTRGYVEKSTGKYITTGQAREKFGGSDATEYWFKPKEEGGAGRRGRVVKLEQKSERAGGRATRPGELIEKMYDTGTSDIFLEMFSKHGDSIDTLMTGLDLNTLRQGAVDTARKLVKQQTQDHLKKRGITGELTVYRSGSIDRDVVNVTTDRGVARRASESYASGAAVEEYKVPASEVLFDTTMMNKRTFDEQEFVVPSRALLRDGKHVRVDEAPRDIDISDMKVDGEVRGTTTINKPIDPMVPSIIELTRTADPVTMIHELFHLTSELLLTPQQRRDLYFGLGVKDVDNITVDQMERVARLGEKYMLRGLSPDPKLQNYFDMLSAYVREYWVTSRQYWEGTGELGPEQIRAMDKLYLPDVLSQAQARELTYATSGHDAAHRKSYEDVGLMAEANVMLQTAQSPEDQRPLFPVVGRDGQQKQISFADNINLNKITGSNGWRDMLVAAARTYGESSEKRTDTVTWAETAAIARSMGLNKEDIRLGVTQKKGAWVWDSATMDAARDMSVRLQGELNILVERYALKSRHGELSDLEKADLVEKLYEWRSFQEALGAQTSEVARTLNVLKRVKKVGSAELDITRQDHKDMLTGIVRDFEHSGQGGRSLEWDKLLTSLSMSKPGEEMAGVIRDAMKPSRINAIEEIWTANLLTGLKTHARNFGSNAAFALWRVPEVQLAGMMGEAGRLGEKLGLLDHKERGRVTDGMAYIYGYARSSEAIVTAMQRVLASSQGVNNIVDTEIFKTLFGEHVNPKTMEAARNAEVKEGIQQLLFEEKVKPFDARAFRGETFGASGKVGKAIDVIGDTTRMMSFDMLQVGDVPFKVMGYTAELSRLAWGKATGELGYRHSLTYSPRFAERVRWHMDNPTATMIKASQENARYQTFTQKAGPTANALRAFAGHIPIIGKQLAPFAKVGAQIMRAGAERGLPGYGLAAMAGRKLAGNEPKTGIGALQNPNQQQLAAMVMGNAVATWVAYQAAQGLFTGGGPPDWNDQQAWRQVHSPYSMRITNPVTGKDEYVSIGQAIEPLGVTMGFGADLGTNQEFQKVMLSVMETIGVVADFTEIAPYADPDQSEAIAAEIVSSISKMMLDRGYWTGLSNALQAASGGESEVRRFTTSYTKSYTPRWLQQFRYQDDPVRRETYASEYEGMFSREFHTNLNALRDTIATTSRNLPPKRDDWGKPVRVGGALGPDIISTYYVKEMQEDPVRQEQVRLGMSFGNFPRVVDGYRLGPWQRDHWQRVSGNVAMDGITINTKRGPVRYEGMRDIVLDRVPVDPTSFGSPDGLRPPGTKGMMPKYWSDMSDEERSWVMKRTVSQARSLVWRGSKVMTGFLAGVETELTGVPPAAMTESHPEHGGVTGMQEYINRDDRIKMEARRRSATRRIGR